MKADIVAILSVFSCTLAQADISYTQNIKVTGGVLARMAGNAGSRANKIWVKGRKVKMDDGSNVVVMDLDAQTVTTIDSGQKTYSVREMSDLKGTVADLNATGDFKETGQKKVVNGFSANEAIMTMAVDAPSIGRAQVEVDMWLSAEVPGAQEVRAIYSNGAATFPLQTLGGAAAGPAISSASSALQKRMASVNGVPVQQIVRLKAAGAVNSAADTAVAASGPSAAQIARMRASLGELRKQVEAAAAQGGPAAADARHQLALIGPRPIQTDRDAGSAGSNWLLEMTIDSSGFSDAAIPDSVFEIPAGYQNR